MKEEKLKVGQVLYKPVYSRNVPPTIKEVTITKIGRTYLYIDNNNTPIVIHNLTHENKIYNQYNFTLYESEQEILDLWEVSKLQAKMAKFFDWMGGYKKLSLKQLKEIEKIIEP